ncbi:HTH-type transcriptional activator RhaS [Salmonella enterica subsp. enterica]
MKRKTMGWLIVFLLFIVYMLNYMDRSALSITAPLIEKELGFNAAEMGMIFSAFFIGYALFNFICSRKFCRRQKRGMTMSRRNTDAITIHSILDWIEDNLESPLSLEKVSERSGYSKWHLQRMFKKETGHSLGQYIRSRKMTEIAQKLKESNEPILYLAERYGFESQQTLTRTFKNYFDVPPHKYRITNMHGESRYMLPLNHGNY